MTSKSKSKDEYEDIKEVETVDVTETEIVTPGDAVCSEPPKEEHVPREIVPAESEEGYVELRGDEVFHEKDRLLEKYHRKNGSLIQNFSRGQVSAEDGIDLLIMELLRETDSLKGSQLLFASRGNVRDEATIVVKRIEALEKIAKTIHRKQRMINEEVINLDSPYIRLLVTYMVNKMRDTFMDLGTDPEQITIFLEKFQSLTDGWKKEVKREMVAFKDRKMMGDDGEEEED
jgi:hypothetical protein